MDWFELQIVTTDGVLFQDIVEKIIVRTVDGDVGIYARHIPYMAAINAGSIKIIMAQGRRYARCTGVLYVSPEMVYIIAREFLWEEAA